MQFAVAAASLLTGAAAVGNSHTGLRHLGRVVTDSDPVADGFRGNDLGMKGVGFQAGFVGTLPEFGKLKFPSVYSIDPMRCPTGMWQVGCVYDTQTDAQIWYKKEIPKEDQVPMTPELCFHFCKNVSGVQFMGLHRGDDCYCTPFFHNTNKGGHGDCDSPCTGDNSRMCGGPEMVDIYQLHDCNNLPALPCKTPARPVEHAKLFKSRYYRVKNKGVLQPCKNAVEGPLSTYNMLCSVECDFGYELFENNYKCAERGNPLSYSWAQLVGSATCTPVVCGVPMKKLNSKSTLQSLHYLQKADYTCDVGYTLNQEVTGQIFQKSLCQGTAEFVKVENCLPVKCGECPRASDKPKYANSRPVEEDVRVYLQSCNYVCDTGYTLDQTPMGLGRHSINCMSTGEFTEPKECLPVLCGVPSSFVNTDFEGPHKKDDNVVFPEVLDYKCENGYTFNQAPSGPTEFQIECQANGIYSEHKTCKPVLCGAPPEVPHSTFNPRPLVFLETVSYRCITGYTLSGEAGTTAQKTIMCGADGQFEQDAPICKPVVCGTPPVVGHGELKGASKTATINFASPALNYQCDAGWSNNVEDTVWTPYGSHTFEIRCQPDGTFQYPPDCLNINDCRVADCGSYGTCKDLDDPTGVHLDDYTCECISGYEITLHPSSYRANEEMKQCTNIMDCPRPLDENCGALNKHGGRRGTCTDLINDYNCVPSVGYEVSHLESEPNNQTCIPKNCGSVPDIMHATCPLDGKSANFDTDPWTYTCDQGYSLTGVYGGETAFEMRCLSTALFSPAEICMAVTCGEPPAVEHTDELPVVNEFFFPEKIQYTCEEGYSLNHQAGGPIEFDVECQHDGTPSSTQVCHPVECGTVPDHADASWDNKRIFVYTELARIECDNGFSLDQSTAELMKRYNLPCLSDGNYGDTRECKRILCHRPPQVAHAQVPNEDFVFEDVITYELDKGFTLDQKPKSDKNSKFEITCQANGKFTDGQEPKPVSCGNAPSRDKATTAPASYHYKQKALYTCLNGYSADGEPSGPKTFELECLFDGTYDGQDGCLPVKCGSVDTPPHTKQIDDSAGNKHTSLVYGQVSAFECKPGWSNDGILFSSDIHGDVVCQADGSLHYPPECQNVDDCVSAQNNCAPNGKCVDLEDPSGVHEEDLRCKCNPGFKDNVTEGGIHYCYNIPDCPESQIWPPKSSPACEPGSCHDLVLDYECDCPAGYYEDANPEKDWRHDCLPVLCGAPPSVDHAKTNKKGEDIYFDDDQVTYTCNEGYTLSGVAGTEDTFHIRCQADESFSAHATCNPVQCGPVPVVDHSQFATGSELVFPQTMDYECDEGYSTDQKYIAGFLQLDRPHHTARNATHLIAHEATRKLGKKVENTEFSTECQSNGEYTDVPECLPVKCPSISSQDHVVSNADGGKLVYPQDVAQVCKAGFALDAFAHDNKDYTIKCLSNAELGFVDNSGQTFEQLGSEGCTHIDCGDLPRPKHAEVKGSTKFGGSVQVTCNTGHTVSQACGDTEGNGFYSFACQTTGDYSDHPDCKAVRCPTPPTIGFASFDAGEFFFEDQIIYSSQDGYTLNGKANGDRSFAITCDADCTYSGHQSFQPVQCGSPPTKSHSSHPGIERVFEQIEPYTCKTGYTVTGQATGPKAFDLTCTAKGEYDGEDGCVPVDCGNVVIPSHSDYTGSKNKLVFPEIAEFECNPGYSLNAKMDGGVDFSTHCMADGQQSAHDGCHNKNDCEGNKCGNGECIDHEKPTGKHLDDYHCQCESGYEEKVEDGYRVCGNIPDCPEGACEPGHCEDLVNDYKCHCDEGYYEGENKEKGWEHDCLPEPCGTPAKVPHASTDKAGTDIFFNSNPVPYTCDEGYTLDGAAKGNIEFELTCQATGQFSKAPTCHPVSCGDAPHVDHSKGPPGEHVFPETLTYDCNAGYSINSKASGAKSFEAKCESDGALSGMETCDAVQCPSIPTQDNAEYEAEAKLVFPQKITATCTTGHALREDEHDAVTYDISCADDGKLAYTDDSGCKPISCGPMPKVNNADVSGSHLFGEEGAADCKVGFSTDRTTNKAAQMFTFHCQADGSFSTIHKCQPVSCGEPSIIDHAEDSAGKTEQFFQDEMTYTLAEGYTLSGQHDGQKTFKVECLDDGTFTELKIPLPVECGPAPKRKHAHTEGTEFVFSQTAEYTCEQGYSLDGRHSGDTAFQLTCEASGEYSGPEGCVPIECGDIIPLKHATQVADQDGEKHTSLVFPQYARFECEPGYSRDGVLGSTLTVIDMSCQKTGEITVPAECINMDDCISPENACSPDGRCVDAESPTGKHDRDFSCECDSGFAQAIMGESIKHCENIPDCPKGACEPGSCHDLVNDYECECPSGYFQDANPAEQLDHDCLPEECGPPPKIKHASTSIKDSVFFDSEPVPFECSTGYTLDGTASGPVSFTVQCEATASFSDPTRNCKPVECGPPPKVDHSLASEEGGLTFEQTVEYTCAKGYSTDGSVEAKSFTATCNADGEFDGLSACERIICMQKVPTQPHASVMEDGETLLFEEKADVVCNAGYALDAHDLSLNAYEIECKADGELHHSVDGECIPIDCLASNHAGATPEIADAILSGSSLFGERVTATGLAGFTLDGNSAGDSDFSVQCGADGEFSPLELPKFQPVQCNAVDFDEAKVKAIEECAVRGVVALKDHNGMYCRIDAGHADVVCDQEHAGPNGQFEAVPRGGNKLGLKAASGNFVTVNNGNLFSSGKSLVADAVFEAIANGEHAAFKTATGKFISSTGGKLALSGSGDENSPSHKFTIEGTFSGLHMDEAFIQTSFRKVNNSQTSRSSKSSLKRTNKQGKRKGTSMYGDAVVYQCRDGFRAITSGEATLEDPEEFTLLCSASGDLVVPHGGDYPSCQPLSCDVEETSGSDFKVFENSKCPGSEANILEQFEGSSEKCMQECRSLAGCIGFRRYAETDKNRAGTCTFKAGEFQEIITDGKDGNHACYKKTAETAWVALLAEGETFPLRRLAHAHQSYSCITGYSLDGTPSGGTDFQEKCLGTAEMSRENKCKDIDFCVDNHCGKNGECHDGLVGYTCSCNVGYKVGFTQGILQTCVEINECDTEGGTDNCDGGGSQYGECVDEVNGYTCNCHEGYEASDDDGQEVCKPIECNAPPHIDHSGPASIPKLVYMGTVDYTCKPGYTTDAKVDGGTSFTGTCGADKEVSGLEECKAIECGSTQTVNHGKVDKSSLVFKEEAKYSCDEGHTTTGAATGPKHFEVSCQADGTISDVLDCVRISCGLPPTLPNAGVSQEEVTWDNKATYRCKEGYTETGVAGDSDTFEITCKEDGEFSGLSKCMAVECGFPKKISHSEMPILEYAYPEQLQIVCDAGHTVDEDPDGESTFILQCGKDGKFSGYEECKKVRCGTPSATDNAETTDSEKFYTDMATWTCKDGYSLDGTPDGPKTFQKECGSTGEFGTATPSDCQDIDFCHGEPCTANGACTDSGDGVPAPGYSCECFEGFEVAERAGGGEKCSEDDCAGNPCGVGGTCTDMSAQGAPAGTYACACDDGYELVEETMGQPTCRRRECGIVPAHTMQNLMLGDDGNPSLTVKTWLGNDPEIDVLYSMPIVFSFDSIEFTCADGHSADGTTHAESKTFNVRCEGSGLFDKPLTGDHNYCLPIECDNTFLPEISHAEAKDPFGKYVFGNKVEFECRSGYTLGGKVGDPASFELDCLADGTYTEDTPSCSPVPCTVPTFDHAHASTEGVVHYNQGVTFLCDDGHYIGGAVSLSTKSWNGVCQANGELDMDVAGPNCMPCSCGVPSAADNVELLEVTVDSTQPWPEGQSAFYRDSYRVKCPDGETVGGVAGGSTFFDKVCQHDGEFSAGAPTHGDCGPPKFQIVAKVVDAQNGDIRLPGAAVKYTSKADSAVVFSATANDNGVYDLAVEGGEYHIEVSKTGSIAYDKDLAVASNINIGQGGDAALSKELGPGEYRVVLTWNRHAEDLDSWTFFDTGFDKYIAYFKRKNFGYSSGIEAALDWDDVDGFGPETSTWSNIGHCTHACLIKFHVDNYTPEDGAIGESGAIITVYRGDGVFKTFTIDEPGNNNRGKTVFTMDASTDPPEVWEGNMIPGAFLDAWAMDYDYWDMYGTGWNRCPNGHILYGFAASEAYGLYGFDEVQYYQVQNYNDGDVQKQEIDWTGLLAAGDDAKCPDGYFIQGLYRTGSAFDAVSGAHQIVKAECVAYSSTPAWGKCESVDLGEWFDQDWGGYMECPHIDDAASALVGFSYVGPQDSLHPTLTGLKHAHCCVMPKSVKSMPADCADVQFCKNKVGDQK